MSKHTPGPWEAIPVRHHSAPPYLNISAKDRIVASIGGTSESSWANARLIAEAPAMLEVLRQIVNHESIEEARYHARAILARIEGEA